MNDGLMWSIMGTGLATVFACLFALILMVRILRAILEGQERRRAAAETAALGDATAAERATPSSSGGDLVAVITAAVAVASGRPASAFRIASIQPSTETTPVWGRVDRIPGPAAAGRR